MKRGTRKGDATKVIGYLRVSTDAQDLGPVAQRSALEAWCAARGASLVAVFEDKGISGGAELDKRPGLLGALSAVKAHGAGLLLVAKRDRLARDVVVAAMIERVIRRHGADVVAADGVGNGDGPADEFMRTVIDGAAQYERALIRARTRAALAVKRSRGEKTGGSVPFGFRLEKDGVHLVADDGEQTVIAVVRQLRVDGLSIRGIVERLNADGVRGRGSRWHKTSVVRLLDRGAA
ncbi:MAG: recombinase family protein [Proteobacteria bacterium]|nr:recombinase family protein [Pseudomonadota bacterium]